MVEGEQLSRLTVAQLYEYRAARRHFSTPASERLYRVWLSDGERGVTVPPPSAELGTGRLVVRQLANPYQQFGSLAGVA